MFSKYKNFIIGTLVIILAFIIYTIFFAADPQKESLLQSSTPKEVDKLGTEIISQLRQIQGLNLESDIFNDPVFNYLKDHGREIKKENVGRSNPFAPLGTEDAVVVPETSNSPESASPSESPVDSGIQGL